MMQAYDATNTFITSTFSSQLLHLRFVVCFVFVFVLLFVVFAVAGLARFYCCDYF